MTRRLLVLLLLLMAAEAVAAPARNKRRTPVAAAKPASEAPPAPAPAPDPWQVARSLADAGQPDSALAVTRAALARDPASFELRWLEAGLLGETGNHEAAVSAYERLSADHPERAAELLADLGRERQRAGAFDAAIRDYRAWLVTHPADRDIRERIARSYTEADSLRAAVAVYDTLIAADSTDVGAALARARLLGWLGRHREAMTGYERVLAHEPGNAEARVGLAMNENWSGRHRVAARRLESLLREPGADPELRKTLAFARYWDDDPDAAREQIESYLAASPSDSEAVRLLRRITREQSSRLSLGFARSDDSDGLREDTPWAEVTWSPWVRTRALVGWRSSEARDASGHRQLASGELGLSHRLDSRWSLSARGSWSAWGDSLGTRPGGELGVVHRPSERLRLEVAVARQPVRTLLALANGITRLDWIAAADWRALERLGLHADARAGYWSDGNRSERVAASARYRLRATRFSETSVGVAAEQLNVHQDLAHGYYDPDFHVEWGPRLEQVWTPVPQWRFGGSAQSGWQRDKGARAEAFYNVSARMEWSPREEWTLGAEAGRGDSNLQSAGGYQRRWWELSLSRAF